MTVNEQIQEMARDMTTEYKDGWAYCHDTKCGNCHYLKSENYCLMHMMAEKLYTKGYRKVERGEWRWISDTDVMCDKCGKWWSTNDNADAGLWKRCPECGADMRGEEK